MTAVETLTALYETTRDLGITDDLDTLIDDVLRRARELIGFEHCALVLFDPRRESLVVTTAHGYERDVVGLRLAPDEGLTGWAVRHREPVRVGDVGQDPRYVPGLEGARSDMVVPLIAGNRVIGAINVESTRADAFTEEHEKVLTVLATQAGLAILASRAQARLQQRIEQLDALYRISRETWTDKSFEEVLEQVLEEIHRILPRGGGDCAVLLVDPERDLLVVRAHRGYRDSVHGLEIRLSAGVTGRCVRTGKIQLVEDVSQDPDYIPGVPDARCAVALPLEVEGKVIGVLNVESTEADTFDDEYVRTLAVVSHQVAAVLAATRLQEENRRLAITDPLTGLYNRRYFESRLDEAIERARRYDEGLALLYLDLDQFKQINDEHGHPAGDEVLKSVGAALESALRASDLLGRIGGEEFAALLLKVNPPDVRLIAERLRRVVEQARARIDGGGETLLAVTISIGAAEYPRDGEDLEALQSAADAALYRAKREGRNRVCIPEREGPGTPAGSGGQSPE